VRDRAESSRIYASPDDKVGDNNRLAKTKINYQQIIRMYIASG